MITTPGKNLGGDAGSDAVSIKTLFWLKVFSPFLGLSTTLTWRNCPTGYKEYNMHRRTLNWMGDRRKDPNREVHLDGIGGVSILVKASVHRSGQSHCDKFSPPMITPD